MPPPLTIRFDPPARGAKNPYLPLLADALAEQGHQVEDHLERPQILHVHWPEAPFNAEGAWPFAKSIVRTVLDLQAMRRRGTTIIWTVHNLRSHEHRWPGEAAYRRWLTHHLDGWLTLSEHACDQAMRWPRMAMLPHAVVPIGDVAAEQRPALPRDKARQQLGIGSTSTIVTFGQDRPYKGFDQLFRAFEDLADDDVRLLVPSLEHGVAGLAPSTRARVRSSEGPLSDAELATLIRAADLVVLPYRAITHSASAMLAIGLERRVLVPAIGGLVELAAEFPDWVRLFEPPLSSEDLRQALVWTVEDEPPKPDLSRHAWDQIAGATVALYRRALR